MAETFRTRRLVEFADTDMAGIAHFSSFFRYMESAEHELLRSLGLDVFVTLDNGQVLSFPRVNATCDYLAPAKCADELDIEVSVERLGAKSVAYEFRFLNGEREIAVGRMTCVCCHIKQGRPPESVPAPDRVVRALRPFVWG